MSSLFSKFKEFHVPNFFIKVSLSANLMKVTLIFN